MDEKGEQLGVYPIEEALTLAQERNLDLVEVAPQAKPPVVRILDFGRFLYESSKREREARKAQKAVEIKEIRLRPKTDKYHRGFKLKRARRFLGKGSKVKVRILFRGREIAHTRIGREILDKVATELSDIAVVEQTPDMDGRTMLMVLAPTGGKR